MFVKTIAALGFAASSLALSITNPSSSDFWVQFTSNVIDWSFSSGDPSPVDITITNSNSSFLNGAFFIARGLAASAGSFTVTNVTLRVADGYTVNFVNSTNGTQIFASSGTFQVKQAGTPPATNASATSPGSSSNTSASGSASGSGASGTATTSSSRGAATSNAAAHLTATGLFGQGAAALAASGVVTLLAGFAMF